MNSGLTSVSAKITVSFPYGLCPINRPKPLHSLRSRVTAALFAHKMCNLAYARVFISKVGVFKRLKIKSNASETS